MPSRECSIALELPEPHHGEAPAVAVTEASREEWRVTDRDARFEALKDATILMVDDEPITLEVIQAFLEDAGYRNFIATSRPAEAQQLIELHDPDVVLLDLLMPNVSGFEILETMRANPRLDHVPAIILTSSADPETKLRVLEMGASDFLAKPVVPGELVLRLRNALALKAYYEQIAQFDSLTGLPIRRTFVERLEKALGENRQGGPLAVLHMDLDGFKAINAAHGLQAGDEVLSEVARRLRAVVAGASPAAEFGRSLCRLGSDEFAVILAGIAGFEEAALVAGRLLAALQTPIQAGEAEALVSASIGIAVSPNDGSATEELLRGAVAAAEQAKRAGGSRYEFSSREAGEQTRVNLEFAEELGFAIAADELVVHFQPRLSLEMGRVVALEALVRWVHPTRGLLAPADFIEVAEDHDLDVLLAERVVQEACRRARSWQVPGGESPMVSVNLSFGQFTDPGLVPMVQEALSKTGLEPRFLRFEITERTLMRAPERNAEVLAELRAAGVSVAIDHFGTDSLPLALLKSFPLDELKIDQAFFSDPREGSEDVAIVQAIISFARDLGLHVVAQGVETEEQLDFLRRRGCGEVQGFLIGKPVAADEIAGLAPLRRV